jgi:histone deacetylase complex regulatory component SIN3
MFFPPQPQNIMVTLPGQSPTMHTTNGDGIDVNKESVTAVASTTSELKEVKRSSSASASNTASANTTAASKPADAGAHPAPSTSAASAPASVPTSAPVPAPAPPADAGDGAPRKQLEFSHAIKYVNAIKASRRLMIASIFL